MVTIGERGQPAYRLYREGVADKDTSFDEIVAHLPEDLQVFHTGALTLTPSQLPTTGIFVLTKGTGGAHLLGPKGVVSKPAYPIATFVDTVGAGDSFHSAFLASLSESGELSNASSGFRSETLAEAVDFACAAAAINASRAGCSPPTELEVTRFIAVHHRP